jgi:hypothetical protein
MQNTINLSVADDYSQYPGPRYIKQGEFSGEDFYKKLLNKKFADALNGKTKLIVNLDGCAGFATSFLDEAFGELVYDFTLKKVKLYLILISNEEPEWINVLNEQTFIEWEKRRKEKKKPSRNSIQNLFYIDDNDKLSSYV